MNRAIYDDEIIVTRKKISGFRKASRDRARKQHVDLPRFYRNYVVISDGTAIEDFLVPALSQYVFANQEGSLRVVDVFDDNCFAEPYVSEKKDIAECISFDEMQKMRFTDTAFLLLADSKKHHTKWFDILSVVTHLVQQNEGNIAVFAELIPPVRKLPAEVTSLSEREYDFFIEKLTEEKTIEEDFHLSITKHCRSLVRNGCTQFTMLRFDNIYGTVNSNFSIIDFDSIVYDSFKNGEVMVTKEDNLFWFSCSYAADAAVCVIAAAENAKFGHEYNVSKSHLSLASLKKQIASLFPDKVALKTDGKTFDPSEAEYHCIASLKFFHQHSGLKKRLKSFTAAYEQVLCFRSENPFDPVKKLTVYQGKLRRLKEAEIDILTEIDRICRKHNIKYFLTGGSLLGAVRNNRSIPWDDDLDIGMLRGDFEVFRKVAPRELSPKYVYSSPQTDENCHYFFDKIRLRDTYFSTYYSNNFVFDDGVFVDVIVYDQTTANKLIQQAQIKMITYAIDAIYIRWHNHQVSRRKRISKYLLPVMRRIPFDKYHDAYDFAAMLFAKNTKARFLLDGGAHLINGGFDRNFLDCELRYVDYDGVKAPIPVNYDKFLSYLYGEGYFREPNLSARLGAHPIARLDLGKYLTDNDPLQTFRSVDIRGELFEDEKES